MSVYFPDSPMPKRLREEGSSEVDGSPLILNARDYNRHHRELHAIDCLLRGAGDDPRGFETFLQSVEELADQVSQGVLLNSYSGEIASGSTVPMPQTDVSPTTTSGAVGASDSEINAIASASFPNSGYLTKINAVRVEQYCTDGSAPDAGNRCPVDSVKMYDYADAIDGSSQFTIQETIKYNGIRVGDDEGMTFLNCQRGLNGTTAQDVVAADIAMLIPGMATIMLTPARWSLQLGRPPAPQAPALSAPAIARRRRRPRRDRPTRRPDSRMPARIGSTADPFQVVVSNTAMLEAECHVYQQGSRQRPSDPIETAAFISYSWVTVGNLIVPEGLRTLNCLL